MNDTVEAQGVELEDDEPPLELEELKKRKVPKGRAGSTRPGQPRNIYCHLCGQPTDLKTFRTAHLKVCRRMWREDENSCVKALISMGRLGHDAKGRPFPPEPMLPLIDGDEMRAPDEDINDEDLYYINELARHIWKTHSQYQCPQCNRGFNHERFLKHVKGCHMPSALDPAPDGVHFGRKIHSFRSVETAVTKSYKKVPHKFHDAPVSRPDGKDAALLAPDGLPLYLNRANVERRRGVPRLSTSSSSASSSSSCAGRLDTFRAGKNTGGSAFNMNDGIGSEGFLVGNEHAGGASRGTAPPPPRSSSSSASLRGLGLSPPSSPKDAQRQKQQVAKLSKEVAAAGEEEEEEEEEEGGAAASSATAAAMAVREAHQRRQMEATLHEEEVAEALALEKRAIAAMDMPAWRPSGKTQALATTTTRRRGGQGRPKKQTRAPPREGNSSSSTHADGSAALAAMAGKEEKGEIVCAARASARAARPKPWRKSTTTIATGNSADSGGRSEEDEAAHRLRLSLLEGRLGIESALKVLNEELAKLASSPHHHQTSLGGHDDAAGHGAASHGASFHTLSAAHLNAQIAPPPPPPSLPLQHSTSGPQTAWSPPANAFSPPPPPPAVSAGAVSHDLLPHYRPPPTPSSTLQERAAQAWARAHDENANLHHRATHTQQGRRRSQGAKNGSREPPLTTVGKAKNKNAAVEAHWRSFAESALPTRLPAPPDAPTPSSQPSRKTTTTGPREPNGQVGGDQKVRASSTLRYEHKAVFSSSIDFGEWG